MYMKVYKYYMLHNKEVACLFKYNIYLCSILKTKEVKTLVFLL